MIDALIPMINNNSQPHDNDVYNESKYQSEVAQSASDCLTDRYNKRDRTLLRLYNIKIINIFPNNTKSLSTTLLINIDARIKELCIIQQ